MLPRLLLFLLLNCLALGIGGYFTGAGVRSDWYVNLSKAPWTPPGWVFGFAWTSIMICFSIYMAFLWKIYVDKKRLVFMYGLQWILNVIWNPLFFYFHQTVAGMVDISALTILVGWFFFEYRRDLQWKSALILPYLIWLLIASSLNGFIVLGN
jgi:tryptophan-rich sensory protein